MNDHSLNVIQSFWLVLITFIVAVFARRVKVPYSLALVVSGLIIGFPHLLPQVHLDPQVLFTVFLPPLLFESAINLRVGLLKRDWKTITIYTLAGTFFSTFIVGWLTAWAFHLPSAIALVFGALISPTDPISVMGIFKRLGAGRRLTLLIEAESLFNDAVAVVLFTIMLGAVSGSHISSASGVLQFLRLAVGGAALGIAVGAIASRVHYELDDHLIEITLTTIVAFGSYLSAEALHLSGVMAVITAGIVIGNYGMQTGMSPSTRLAMTAFWEYAGFVVNSIVFLLIGIEVGYVHWAHKLGVALGAALVVLVGRAAIYPLSLLVNRLGGRVLVSWQHVLFWGGLRGALSMALVLGLDRSFPQRETLIAATFGVVLFSLLVQGVTLGPLLQRLGLTKTPSQEIKKTRQLAAEMVAVQAALAELGRLHAAEAYPNWSVEVLMQDYRARLSVLEEALDALQPEHRLLTRQQVGRARSSALAAEKSAWQEAERQGWLAEEDWQQIAARIDAELIALQTDSPEH